MGFRVVIQSLVWAAAAFAPLQCALAQPVAPASKPIYSCTDAAGNKLTSDRQIDQCRTREQRIHNADGSLRGTIPPTLTLEEQAAARVHDDLLIAEQRARQDAIRNDRNLLVRYPNETAHRKAREAALDDVRKAASVSEARMTLLAVERRPLLDEAEFYVGRPLPLKLRAQLDANDAATDALRIAVQYQQAEAVRINRLYDTEFERLQKLWSGALPGSMGMLPATASAATSSAAH